MGWDMQSGIAKVKRFLKPAKPVSVCWFEGARAETAPLRTLDRGCPELSLPISLFISILSLPLCRLPSPCSSLTTEAFGAHDYPPLPSTHSVHTVQYIVLEIGTAGAVSLISNIDQEINPKEIGAAARRREIRVQFPKSVNFLGVSAVS